MRLILPLLRLDWFVGLVITVLFLLLAEVGVFSSLDRKAYDLGVRFSATDWVDDSGWALEDATKFSAHLKELGCDFIDVSSGGNSPLQKIKVGPGYQTGFANHIRRETGLTTMAVGMINDPRQAETIVATGQADFVALARGMLYDPRWAWHAAEVLRSQATFPPQYMRSHPTLQGEPIPGNPPKK